MKMQLMKDLIAEMRAVARGEAAAPADATLPSMEMSDDDFRIEEGSGNVFADIGLPNPEERLKKAEQIFAARRGKADFDALDRILRRKSGKKLGPPDTLE